MDSGIFKKENISQIGRNEVKKAEPCSLLLVHWKDYSSLLTEILAIKKDSLALIIYAPQEEGKLGDEDVKKLGLHRNTLIVNFRGRLLNDVLISLMTTRP